MCISFASSPYNSRVAMLVATTHFVETYFKFQAPNGEIQKFGYGNVALGALLIVTLLMDYARSTSPLAAEYPGLRGV